MRNMYSRPAHEETRPREREYSDITRESSHAREAGYEVRVGMPAGQQEERPPQGGGRYQLDAAAYEGIRNNNNTGAPRQLGKAGLGKKIEDVFRSATEGFADRRYVVKLFLFVSALNWLFVTVATAISQLDLIGGKCYTFWGQKENCDTISYTVRTQLLTCKELKLRLQVGAAFSIFSILLMAIVLYLTFKAMMNLRQDARNNRTTVTITPSKWTIVGVAAVAEFCELVCWSMTVSVYYSRYCENTALPRTSTYGPGFGLLVTAWTLGAVALLLFAVVV